MLPIIVLLSTLFVASLAAPQTEFDIKAEATDCDKSQCLLPNCRCPSTSPPEGIELASIPQFVFLTFDDDVQVLNYDVYTELFYSRKNPDGCPLSATFFVSHEYTDYSEVHDLYVHGHEIALHSVTHQALTDYWRNLSVDALTHEFGDEKTLIVKFANIPEESIKGMRLPFLQLSGDNSFQVAKDIGLEYDCSWSTNTFRKPGLWPYTLDYKSIQDCPIGPCPTSSIPGLWVVPMIDLTDQQNVICNMVDACVNVPDEADELNQWFIDNFNVQYKGNRAPFGFYLHSSYFGTSPVHLESYKKFVDYLQSLNDVYIVNIGRAIDWIKNPVPLGSSDWPACPEIEDLGCSAQTCELDKGQEKRYMTLCGDCPAVYPWIGNPYGAEQ